MTGTRPNAAARSRTGFSLIEVTVAIGVVGVGMVAVLSAVTGLSGSSAHVADATAAAALAGNLMAEIDTRAYEGFTPTPTGRVTAGLVAYHPFADGSGATASDESRLTPLAPLTFADPALVTWIPGSNGVNVADGGKLENTAGTAKIVSPCVSSGGMSVEVWFVPASIVCGECPVISLGKDDGEVDFVLAQKGPNILFYVRTSKTDAKGRPAAATMTSPLTGATVHCIATFDGSVSTVYVNGVAAAQNALIGGNLSSWRVQPLRIGQMPGFSSRWSGKLFLSAIYSRAVTLDEVRTNYAVGPSPSSSYNRLGYDDIDDYNGYADCPPRAEDGSAIAGAAQFARTVSVANVLPGSLMSVQSWNSTDAKRITVRVYRNCKLLAELVRARYKGVSTEDTPDPGY